MTHPKPILDYSSPSPEHAREQKLEKQRRDALDAYNESTFGQRHPIPSTFFAILTLAAMAFPLVLFLPHGLGTLLSLLLFAIYSVWKLRTNGWRPPRPSIRRPFQWW